MTTNKPGSVNQQPLYGCTSCYEDYSWPASDLRVYDGECWCDLCWHERQWELPGRLCWNDLESYTPTPLPAEQQPAPDASALVEALTSDLSARINRVSRRSLDGSVVMSSEEWNGIVELVEKLLTAAHRIKENENGNG